MTIYEKLLNKRKNDRGYLEVKFSINHKGSYNKIHRLVAQAFIPNPENKPEVNHKDTNKENNNVNNLEWSTHSENQQHAFKNNLYDRKWNKNSCNKLNESDVVEIRRRKNNNENIKVVYEEYKHIIGFDGFKAVWYGYNWKHIKQIKGEQKHEKK